MEQIQIIPAAASKNGRFISESHRFPFVVIHRKPAHQGSDWIAMRNFPTLADAKAWVKKRGEYIRAAEYRARAEAIKQGREYMTPGETTAKILRRSK